MAYDIGPKIGIEGERDFREAIVQINTKLKTLGTEMQAVASAYDKNDNSVQKLTAKQGVLNQQITAQLQKLNAMHDGLDAAAEKYGENSEITQKWQQQVNKATTQLNRLESELQENSRAIEEASQSISEYADAQEEAARAADEMERRQKAAAEQVALMSDKLQKSAATMQTVNRAALAVAGSVAALGLASAKVGMDFEAQMSKVEAISGATADEMAALTAKAQEMGASTKFTATESGQALEYMAMAGWKSQQMIDGLPGIMNLAAASGEELGSVSDIVTDALTAFGLAASDSAHFADVLAKASSSSNTNVSLMGATFKYAAPVAGALGYSIEDTATAIGLMANAGIKGEMAGTALRGMLTNLAKPSDQVAQYMDDLGISLTDTAGNVKPLNKLLIEMRKKFAKLTDAQKAEYAAGIAGKEAMSGMLAIVNSGDADFDGLTKAISQSDGTAKHMADTMNKNLKGQLTLLGSAAEGAGIAMYDKFAQPAAEAVGKLADKVGEFAQKLSSGELDDKLQMLATAGATAATAIVGLNAVLVVKDVANFASAVKAGGAALEGYAAATKAGAAAQGALNLAQSLSPMGIAATAASAAAVGLGLYLRNTVYAKSEVGKFDDKLKDLNKRLGDQAEKQAETASARADNLAGVQNEIAMTQSYVSELGSYLDGDKRVIKGYEARASYLKDQINKLIPDAVQSNEDEMGSIYEITDAINDQIFAKQKALTLEAMQEEYMSAIEGRADAENRFTEAARARGGAQQQLNETEAKYNELLAAQSVLQEGQVESVQLSEEHFGGMAVSLASIGQELDNVSGQQEVWQRKLEETTPAYQEAKSQLDKINDIMSSYNAATAAETTQQLNTAVAGLSSTVVKFTGDNKQALAQAVADTQLSYNRMVADTARGWEDMDETQRAQWISILSNMKRNLDEQVSEARDGGFNIADATGEGCAQGAYIYLDEIKDMLDDGEVQLRAAGEDAIGLGTEYDASYGQGMKDNIDAVLSAVQAVNSEVETALNNATSEAEKSGGWFAEGYAKGITSAKDIAVNAAAELANSVQAMVRAINKEGSPSKVMIKSGMWFDLGYAKGIEDNSDKAESAAEKMSKKVLSAANKWIEEQKHFDRLAIGDEVDFWEQMTHVAELQSDELQEVYKKLYSAKADASRDSLDESRKWIETEKFYNRLSAEDELAAWTRVVNRKNLLTSEQIEAEKELYSVQQDISSKQQAQLKEYASNLQARAEALGSYAGLFDEIGKDSDVTGKKLMQNLKDQVNVFKNWQDDMQTLADKGVTGALLDELQQLGPSAAQEIHALSTMSEKELKEYAALFDEKAEMIEKQVAAEIGPVPITIAVGDVDISNTSDATGANAIATALSTTLVSAMTTALTNKAADLTGAGSKTMQSVASGMATAEPAVQTQTDEIMQNAADLAAGYEDVMHDIGGNLMAGVAKGVRDGRSGVVNEVRSALEAAARAAREAMDINSPSKVFDEIGDYMGQGVGVGFVRRMKSVAREIADSIPVPVPESQTAAAERIGEATVNGIAAAMQGGGAPASSPIVVQVQLDRKTIAQAIYDPLKQVGRQRGN